MLKNLGGSSIGGALLLEIIRYCNRFDVPPHNDWTTGPDSGVQTFHWDSQWKVQTPESKPTRVPEMPPGCYIIIANIFRQKGSDWIRLEFAHPFPLNSGAPIAYANFISDGKVQVSPYNSKT